MDGCSHLRILKILMILAGQWKFDNTTIIKKLYNHVSDLVLALFTICTHYLLLTIVFYHKCSKAVFESAFYYVHFIIAIILTILLKSEGIKKYLRWILEYEKNVILKKEKEALNIYQKFCKKNNALVLFFILNVNIVSWMWYFLGQSDSEHAEFEPDCPLNRGFVFQIWYPFSSADYPWICSAFDKITVFCGMLLFSYYKTLPLSLVIFLLSQISLLKYYFKNTNSHKAEIDNSDFGNRKSSDSSLKDCVRMHQYVIRLMNWVQFSLKEIIFIQYCSYVLDTAAFMIPILTEDSLEIKIRCFAAFTMSVIQMYFFFYFANEIQVQSASISDVIYNENNWLEATQNDKTTLLLMMMRSQQQLSLKSVAIGEMSLDSFTKIMRICYSTCTFFTTMYHD